MSSVSTSILRYDPFGTVSHRSFNYISCLLCVMSHNYQTEDHLRHFIATRYVFAKIRHRKCVSRRHNGSGRLNQRAEKFYAFRDGIDVGWLIVKSPSCCVNLWTCYASGQSWNDLTSASTPAEVINNPWLGSSLHSSASTSWCSHT